LQEERQRYEAVLAKLLAVAGADDKASTAQYLAELSETPFNVKSSIARS
jgi:hypothetical protein